MGVKLSERGDKVVGQLIPSQYRLVTCQVCPPCSAAVRGVFVRSWWVAGGEGVTEMEGEGVEGWR